MYVCIYAVMKIMCPPGYHNNGYHNNQHALPQNDRNSYLFFEQEKFSEKICYLKGLTNCSWKLYFTQK